MADILEWKDSHPLRYVEEITESVVADVLSLSAKILANRGWTRQTLGLFGGPVCARGAIWEAVGGFRAVQEDGWANLAAKKAEEALRLVPEIAAYGSLPYWNDSAELSQGRVIGVFTDLVLLLRKESA
jgi:hypothetical protein